ncbi:Folate-like transporter 2 [Toxocara canis]|uniref:Folate-like transporter 2 n=1 Tax=Toxocara canis TaxID=6265 RepID=A0A0B2UT26_TOXCA|nr:Folate-like transporter 2 [Toxocara canis]
MESISEERNDITSPDSGDFKRLEGDLPFFHNDKIMKWSLIAVLLVLYGFSKDFKPGEPFLFKYQTEFLNLTEQQLNGEIYPYWTYSYLITLIPIFLLTDILLYKPILILESIGYMVFRSTLVFGWGVFSQQIGMVFYGIASAAEIAFYSYIYAKVEKSEYQKLTSWTRASTMAGRTFGYLLSQLIIITHIGNYLTVNQISLASPVLVLIFGLCFPRVHWKQLVQRMLDSRGIIASDHFNAPQTYIAYMGYRLRKIRSDAKKIYSIGFIRKWSLWWAMTTCMSLQISAYAQTLWGEVQEEETTLNGFAEATYTASATTAILVMNMIPINWDKWGEATLVLISTIDCLLLLIFSRAQSIFVMYGCYICYRTLYQVMITIAQWNLARKMVCESYGLVFGLNSFIALVLQTILTLVVVDKRGFGMDVRSQFIVYGAYHAVIAVIFLCSITYNLMDMLIHRIRVHSDLEGSLKPKTLVNQHSDASIYKICDHIDEPSSIVIGDSLATKTVT